MAGWRNDFPRTLLVKRSKPMSGWFQMYPVSVVRSADDSHIRHLATALRQYWTAGWRLTGKRPPRSVNIATSILVLIGGFIMRYAWISAGRVSADDPEATHYYNAREWREKKG